VESAKPAKISIEGKDGKYTVQVDDGKIMKLTTEPVLGGDNKSPVTIGNTKSPLGKTFNQAKSLQCDYADGDRKFTFKDTNSYFYAVNGKGEL
jgi:hypothetical protein